ncbi:hypothetical protein Fleli_3551 [Bernardetia litoralis DSM 6794]|uniref:Uncharacterized protein n=1 Tax=Bernardetia litoralis (strain ATCC 23117 / DSM 6794 / NBRC 15988 / NCIMB 1366 / Fx l1 / Sio-4) TaxID=880071 RepID=I4API5_BERLS|nr:hypothetical protein Fleli_3551 [Bernardetia litoralis DSM 6794]
MLIVVVSSLDDKKRLYKNTNFMIETETVYTLLIRSFYMLSFVLF